MSPAELLDQDGVTTPAAKALFLGAMLQRIAMLQQPGNWHEIFTAALREAGLKEEECGGDLDAIIYLLVRSGLVLTDAWNDKEQSLLLGQATFRPSRLLTNFVWAEPEFGDVDE